MRRGRGLRASRSLSVIGPKNTSLSGSKKHSTSEELSRLAIFWFGNNLNLTLTCLTFTFSLLDQLSVGKFSNYERLQDLTDRSLWDGVFFSVNKIFLFI